MEPIIPLWMLYLAETGSKIGILLIVAGSSSIVIWCVSFLISLDEIFIDGDIGFYETLMSKAKLVLIGSLLMVIVGIAIPTRSSSYLMIVSSQLKEENLTGADESVKGYVNYIFEQIDALLNNN